MAGSEVGLLLHSGESVAEAWVTAAALEEQLLEAGITPVVHVAEQVTVMVLIEGDLEDRQHGERLVRDVESRAKALGLTLLKWLVR